MNTGDSVVQLLYLWCMEGFRKVCRVQVSSGPVITRVTILGAQVSDVQAERVHRGKQALPALQNPVYTSHWSYQHLMGNYALHQTSTVFQICCNTLPSSVLLPPNRRPPGMQLPGRAIYAVIL